MKKSSLVLFPMTLVSGLLLSACNNGSPAKYSVDTPASSAYAISDSGQLYLNDGSDNWTNTISHI